MEHRGRGRNRTCRQGGRSISQPMGFSNRHDDDLPQRNRSLNPYHAQSRETNVDQEERIEYDRNPWERNSSANRESLRPNRVNSRSRDSIGNESSDVQERGHHSYSQRRRTNISGVVDQLRRNTGQQHDSPSRLRLGNEAHNDATQPVHRRPNNDCNIRSPPPSNGSGLSTNDSRFQQRPGSAAFGFENTPTNTSLIRGRHYRQNSRSRESIKKGFSGSRSQTRRQDNVSGDDHQLRRNAGHESRSRCADTRTDEFRRPSLERESLFTYSLSAEDNLSISNSLIDPSCGSRNNALDRRRYSLTSNSSNAENHSCSSRGRRKKRNRGRKGSSTKQKVEVLFSRNYSPERNENNKTEYDMDTSDESDNSMVSRCSTKSKQGHEESQNANLIDGDDSLDNEIGLLIWDMKSCPAPSLISKKAIIDHVHESFLKDYKKIECVIMCDEGTDSLNNLGSDQITVVVVSTKDNFLGRVQHWFKRLNDDKIPTHIVLITGSLHIDLHVGPEIMLTYIYDEKPNEMLISLSQTCMRFSKVLTKMSCSERQDKFNVLVSNLPRSVSKTNIKYALRGLCKFKYFQVTIRDDQALLSFAVDDIGRTAAERLNGADIFGKTIKARMADQETTVKFGINDSCDKATLEEPNFQSKHSVQIDAESECKKFRSFRINIKIPIAIDMGTFRSYLIRHLPEGELEDSRQHELESGVHIVSIGFDSRKKAEKGLNVLKNLKETEKSEPFPVFLEVMPAIEKIRDGFAVMQERDRCYEQMRKRKLQFSTDHRLKIEKVNDEMNALKTEEQKLGDNPNFRRFQQLSDQQKAVEAKLEELHKQETEFQLYTSKLLEELDKDFEIITHDTDEKLDVIRQQFGRECNRFSEALPIYAAKSEVINTIKSNQVTIVLAETGSGKSTQMVQYLHQCGLAETGMIACTQPRKLAATSLAQHVAHQMAAPVGHVVGYHVGLSVKKNKQLTKIMYMTDHTLLNEILVDADLTQYSCIVIDEAHERSLHTDLLLAMLKKCLTRRPELKVVITSATIDPDIFIRYFNGCPVVKVSGRTYPVDVIWKDINFDMKRDYVKEAADKAVWIHQQEGVANAGDILVFLTNPVEIDQAINRVTTLQGSSNDIIALPLHGKLQPDEQRRVFDPPQPRKRKIIFATNVAETSITIKGIKFVVDSGMMKSLQYDTKRNIGTLALSLITRSSADQRKGRAGRTEPGKCYRLFSQDDYDNMKSNQLPELLKVHLGQALLKLLDLGVTDPLSFDFVEAPPQEALEVALDNLEALGAVQNGCITALGKQMAKIPLVPALSKLVLDGLKHNVGYEALVIAACATIGGSIFFRAGSDKEKLKADSKKVPFCQIDGDLITSAIVYNAWAETEERQKSKWCLDNSINGKSMKMVRDTIREVTSIIRNDMALNIALQPGGMHDEAKFTLRKLIFECFWNNLCIFYGHEKAGYRHSVLQQQVHIHPSSALVCLEQTPKYIVYSEYLKTTRDFILNVTPVEEEWVIEAIRRSHLNLDLSVIDSVLLKPKVIHPLGQMLIIKNLIGTKFVKGKALEDQFKQMMGANSIAIVDPRVETGELRVYLPSVYHGRVEPLVNELLKNDKADLLDTVKEQSVDNTQMRRIWGKGAETCQVLLQQEFCHITVSNYSDYYKAEDVPQLFAGEVLKSYEMTGTNPKVNIIFRNPTSAMAACEAIICEGKVVVKPRFQPRNYEERKPLYKLKLQWSRRKCRQFGFIQFESSVDFVIAAGRMIGLPWPCRPSNNNTNELFVSKVFGNPTNQDFQKTVTDYFDKYQIKVKKANLGMTTPYDTTNDEISQIQEILMSNLNIRGIKREDAQIHIMNPKRGTYDWLGFIYFQIPSDGHKVFKACEQGQIVMNDDALKATPMLESSLYCRKEVYDAIKTEVVEIIQELDSRQKSEGSLEKGKLKMEAVQRPNGQMAITMFSDNLVDVVSAQMAIGSLLAGYQLACASPLLHRLLCGAGKVFLNEMMRETKTFVTTDIRKMLVTIFGTTVNTNKALQAINKYIDKISLGILEEEERLAGPGKPKGLIRELLRKYDSSLELLRVQSGLHSLEINVSQRRLKMVGSEESQKKAKELIENCIKDLNTIVGAIGMEDESQEEDCPVCFGTIDTSTTEAHFRLELCGHAYCWECVKGQLSSNTVPIMCCMENCNQPFVVKDLDHLFHKYPDLGSSVMKESIRVFVSANSEDISPCITPDCSGLFRIEKDGNGKRFICPQCHNEVCTKCKVRYHHELDCEMYQCTKKDPDYPVKIWLQEDPSNRKLCPKCKAPIEKNEGCNHMTCKNCKGHFCWICSKAFPIGTSVYNHITSEHGRHMILGGPHIPGLYN